MYRKLVPYAETGYLVIDQVALRRTAEQLLALIPTLPSDEPYGIYSRLLPALKQAIEGAIQQPIRDERQLVDGKFIYEDREGLLPAYFTREFLTAFANFSVTAQSLPLDPPEIEMVDGQQCAWMDFEEEGDWPDKVKYP